MDSMKKSTVHHAYEKKVEHRNGKRHRTVKRHHHNVIVQSQNESTSPSQAALKMLAKLATDVGDTSQKSPSLCNWRPIQYVVHHFFYVYRLGHRNVEAEI